jgi:hypothetical protein
MRSTLAAALVAALAFTAPILADDDRHDHENPKFSFALIGDAPYGVAGIAKYPNMQQEIDAERLAFVVHDGDFKSGSTLCDDVTFHNRYDLFNGSAHPFVFLFGDNEWTDCHRANNGAYDPLERLALLRQLFTQGDYSLGQRRMKLERQSDVPGYELYRENVRWERGKVLFVGLHVVGSNNNLGRMASADAEYHARNAANLAWMREAFDLAGQHKLRAVMLVMQANPNFELPANDPERTGFNNFLDALRAHVVAYGRPVVLVHGDSHYFRIDKPLLDAAGKRIENFTRVETFGAADVHWLRATVDPRDPNVFGFEQRIVKSNLEQH